MRSKPIDLTAIVLALIVAASGALNIYLSRARTADAKAAESRQSADSVRIGYLASPTTQAQPRAARAGARPSQLPTATTKSATISRLAQADSAAKVFTDSQATAAPRVKRLLRLKTGGGR